MGPKLAAALVAAQAEMRSVAKDSTNPDFRSRYTSLDAIIAAVRPVLAQHGLAIVQGATVSAEGKGVTVSTTIVHDSGEEFTSGVYMPLVGRMLKGGGRGEIDPQAGGSAISYGRRYGLTATLCISTGDEDDDGNAASRPPRAASQPAKARTPAPAGEATPAPVSGKVYEVPNWLGLAGDRPMPLGKHKGTPLGDMDTESLREFEKWAPTQKGLEGLLKDVKTVLAARVLGMDDNRNVAKMHAAIEKDEKPLTALLGKP